MNKIKIFLAVGQEELLDDKSLISNHIRNLNKIYEPYDIFIKLISDDQIKNLEVDQAIVDSELFIVLFQNKIEEKAINELNIAYSNFKKNSAPGIITYIKEGADDSSKEIVSNLMQRLDSEFKKMDSELNHYYSCYKIIDTVILDLILQLKEIESTKINVEAKDGKLYVQEKEFITLDNIPMFSNNMELNALKDEFSNIQETYWDLREKIQDDDQNEEINLEYEKVKSRYKELSNKINEQQKNILALEKSFLKSASNGQLTPKQIYAKNCMEKGNIEEAKKVLDYEEMVEEADILVQKLELNKLKLSLSIKEFIQRANVLKLDLNNENRIAEIEKSYKKAIELEEIAGLAPNAAMEFADFLMLQNEPNKLLEILEKLLKNNMFEDEDQKMYVYYMLANTYKVLEEHEKSRECFESYINYIEKDENKKHMLMTIYMDYVSSEINFYNFDNASKIIDKAKDALKYVPDEETRNFELARMTSNESLILSSKNMQKEAEEKIELALEYFNKINWKDSSSENVRVNFLIQIIVNGMPTYLRNEHLDRAEKLCIWALEILKDHEKKYPNTFAYFTTAIYDQLATIYILLDEHDKAEKYLKQAIKTCKQLIVENEKMYEKVLIGLYVHIATLYIFNENNEECEKYSRLTIDTIGSKIEDNFNIYAENLGVAYNLLATVRLLNYDFEEACKYYEIAIDLLKKLSECNGSVQEKLKDMEKAYKYARFGINCIDVDDEDLEALDGTIELFQNLMQDIKNSDDPNAIMESNRVLEELGDMVAKEEFYYFALIIYTNAKNVAESLDGTQEIVERLNKKINDLYE